jgi:hypothetical protein
MSVRSSALRAGRPLTPRWFPLHISIGGWVNPRATVRLEGLCELKNKLSNLIRNLCVCARMRALRVLCVLKVVTGVGWLFLQTHKRQPTEYCTFKQLQERPPGGTAPNWYRAVLLCGEHSYVTGLPVHARELPLSLFRRKWLLRNRNYPSSKNIVSLLKIEPPLREPQVLHVLKILSATFSGRCNYKNGSFLWAPCNPDFTPLGFLLLDLCETVYKSEYTVVGIRCADHATSSFRKSWRKLRRQAAVSRSV